MLENSVRMKSHLSYFITFTGWIVPNPRPQSSLFCHRRSLTESTAFNQKDMLHFALVNHGGCCFGTVGYGAAPHGMAQIWHRMAIVPGYRGRYGTGWIHGYMASSSWNRQEFSVPARCQWHCHTSFPIIELKIREAIH